jgi:uncharacterized membrane protein
MLFFTLLVVIAFLAWGLRVRGWPARMRIAMAVALLFVGADHWIEMVLFTGAAEIAGALGLLVPRLRRAAGFMLALYFVAVFPANIHNALNGLAVEGLPQAQWYYWVRLAFQPLAIWWALYSAELIRFHRVRAAS